MSVRTVVDDPVAGRFEIRVDDAVAGYAEYRAEGSALALTHTVVESAYEGLGIGSALAQGVLEVVRERGMQVLPYCPFIRGWIATHPGYVDMVPAADRSRFDLPG